MSVTLWWGRSKKKGKGWGYVGGGKKKERKKMWYVDGGEKKKKKKKKGRGRGGEYTTG